VKDHPIFEEVEKAVTLTSLQRYEESNIIFKKLVGRYQFLDAKIFLKIGFNYYFLDKTKEAIDYAEKAISTDPTMHRSHYLKALAFQKRTQPSLQEKFIKLALEMDPINFSYRLLMAQLFLYQKKTKQALELLHKLEEEEPNDDALLYYLCSGYLAQKRYDLFDRKIRTALQLYPNDSDFHYLLSSRKIKNEDYYGAKRSAETALEIQPTNINAQENLKHADFKLSHGVGIGVGVIIIIKIILLILRESM